MVSKKKPVGDKLDSLLHIPIPPMLRLLIFGKFLASNTVTESLLDRG